MSTLSSSSTLDAVKNAYDDNASYDEDASTSKCKIFITACRILLRRLPRLVGKSVMVQLDTNLIRDELEEARRWLALNGDASTLGTSVISTSFEEFR